MKLFIINAHWHNRGDEAALRALLRKIDEHYNAKVYLQLITNVKPVFSDIPNTQLEIINLYPRKKHLFDLIPLALTLGRVAFSKDGRKYIKVIKEVDLVIHGPGGPCIGDIYSSVEWYYLIRLIIARLHKKAIYFASPSMGPFRMKIRNLFRRYILKKSTICVREEISHGYLKEIGLNSTITLDAAFMDQPDIKINKGLYYKNLELSKFIDDRTVGMTITDLIWNPKYKYNNELRATINDTFKQFIPFLLSKGFKILFIPQLFGIQNDSTYMKSFINDHSKTLFVLDERYDTYFQQFVISKLKYIIGMRYHSNIFAAKMGTPFISISYEQKMKGFMKKSKLDHFCIDVENINYKKLKDLFIFLQENESNFKNILSDKYTMLKKESNKTYNTLDNILTQNI